MKVIEGDLIKLALEGKFDVIALWLSTTRAFQ